MIRKIDAPKEAQALLLLREVQEEFDDPEPVLGQIALPVVDRFVPAFPDVMFARLGRKLLAEQDFRMHPDDQHLLVVRPVEDADLPTRRQPLLVAAQEILVELARGRDLEALDPHALRVDAAHHVADRPVLARGIERLQHNQDAVRVLSGQPRLVLREELDAVLQQLDPVLLLLDPRFERGIEVLRQVHLRARVDAERFDEPRDSSLCFVVHDGFYLACSAATTASPTARALAGFWPMMSRPSVPT